MLKRVDINYDTMKKYKINDYFEFNPTIDLSPYTINPNKSEN